jgi:WhiB family redox-sensing transcriptional regulator
MLPRERPDWMFDGLCINSTVDMFPEDGHGVFVAVDLCRRCLVWRECREYALTEREQFGVWGGLSARDRRRVWKSQRVGGAESILKPINHGSATGARTHRRRGEEACPLCLDTERRARFGRTQAEQQAHGLCGTNPGYADHLAAGEPPCPRCEAAHVRAVRRKEREAEKKEQAA